MNNLKAKWAPPSERSRLAGISNAGAQIGNVIALPLGGILCDNGFGVGWPSIFYLFGALGLVWFAAWMLLSAKSPDEHRFIGKVEMDYILAQTSNHPSKQTDVCHHNEIRFSFSYHI